MLQKFGQGTTFGLQGKRLSGASAHFEKVAAEMKQRKANDKSIRRKKEQMAKKMINK